MSTEITSEQAMLRDSAQRFAETEYTFEDRRRRLAADPGEPGCWPSIAALGWLGLPFAESDGGFGGSHADVAVLMHRFGASLVVEPYLESAVIAGGLIARLGTARQKERWLSPMIDGGLRLAFAFAEPQSRYRIDDCLLRAAPSAGGWALAGRKVVVQGGAGADAFVVLARSAGERFGEQGLSLFVVPRDAPGLAIRRYRSYDGRDACDLDLDALRLGGAALLGPAGAAFAEVDRIVDVGAAMSCAEAVGALEVMFDDTLAYLKERRQFGRPLAMNQALQHRLVDMRIQMREAQVMSAMAVDALVDADRLGGAGDALRRRSVSAAKVHVGQALRLIGQESIQMHGAIGTTDDMRISHHFRRATSLAIAFGDVDWHRRRYGELMRASSGRAEGSTMNLLLDDQDRAFADEVREFVRANLPDRLARKVANEQEMSKADYQLWQSALGRRGWLCYTWPKEEGGPGWTSRQQFIFDAICVEMDCPWIVPFGPRMLGPVLQRFGTPAQKARFLPPILVSGEWWCQGYSEPNAGSDLASLITRAERRGDRYVVNGQKIWTSYAHYADWMFCLVRTSKEDKPQKGISFLLIDMKTPGIEVRPIIALDGMHGFNTVFFTDVEVPVENLVGVEGEGWTCAKFLLSHERLETASLPAIQHTLRRLRAIARDPGDGNLPLIDDPAFRDKLVDVEVRATALELRVLGFLQQQDAGASLGPEVSELKIRGTELYQRLLELVMEASGYRALPYQYEFMDGTAPEPFTGPLYAGTAAGRYFARRAYSILGGSNEIQRNVLAKAVLGV